jgi:glutaredoxin 3
MAEKLLQKKGVTNLKKILIDQDPQLRQEMMNRTGRRTVPQIYIGERRIGGFDDLAALDQAGNLDPLLT